MKCLSEKISKNLELKPKTNSETSSSYLRPNQNIENLLNLKNNLKQEDKHSNLLKKFESSFEKFDKENLQISEIFKDEDNILKKLNEESSKFRLNDYIFEEKTIKILCDTFKLKEYDLFPYFDISLTEVKNNKMVKLYYYKVQMLLDNKKFTILFLNDRNTFMTSFEDITLIFEKYKESFNSVTVVLKQFNYFTDFMFQKDGQNWTVNFLFADINEELVKIKNQINETKNKIESENNEDIKNDLKKKLESYNKIYEILKEKYSKTNILSEIKKNQKKIIILEEKIKLNEEKINDYEEKKKN